MYVTSHPKCPDMPNRPAEMQAITDAESKACAEVWGAVIRDGLSDLPRKRHGRKWIG
jgi:hypothetical protein